MAETSKKLHSRNSPAPGMSAKLFVVLVTGLSWISVTLSCFLVFMMGVGAVAYFAKTIFHITPRWMFGLFDSGLTAFNVIFS